MKGVRLNLPLNTHHSNHIICILLLFSPFCFMQDSSLVANRNDTLFSATASIDIANVTENDHSLPTLNATIQSHFSSGGPDTVTESVIFTNASVTESLPDYIQYCPSNVMCERLGADCIDCEYNTSCHYGRNVSVVCHVKPSIVCLGSHNFTRWLTCRYCYQTPGTMHQCSVNTGCRVASAPRNYYEANCTVPNDVLCLGRRQFYKMLPCNWTSGKRWSTALILSITLGGFGADRFYLGLWREGIGKLFSFGGLGVWTLVDVILVAAGYIGPADGSLYIV